MYQDHFSLEAIVTVDGNTLQFKNKPPLFVFNKITGIRYLISSVQDDDLLRWMLSHNNNRLTILKQHFREFQDTFRQIVYFYPVQFIDPQSKKTVPYDFEVVSNHLF